MPITLDEWHVIRLIRSGRTGYLQVDNQPQVEGTSIGAFSQLTLTLDLFIGGHRNFDEISKAAAVPHALKGCIQKVRKPITKQNICKTNRCIAFA